MRISDWSSDVCSSDLYFAAETVENAGELDRDIASSDDHDAARQGFEFEDLVRRDAMLCAVNIRNCRLRPRGDQYFLGGQMQTSNVDGIWSDDPCPAVKEVYIVRGQRLAIQPLEPADFGAHLVAQNLPVARASGEIGRASCRDRGCKYV